MRESDDLAEGLARLGALVLIPVYNHADKAPAVARACREAGAPVLVVDDGSTDGLKDVLGDIPCLTLPVNRGKGRAIVSGMLQAEREGYRAVITMDGDGQHRIQDLPALVAKALEHPGDIVLGARTITRPGERPSRGARFAQKKNNFWVWLETRRRLADTQTGFRYYPLETVLDLRVRSSGYEFEVEILVKAIWAGLGVHEVPILSLYPEDRVSHFRPLRDFLRTSLVHVRLVTRIFTRPKRSVLGARKDREAGTMTFRERLLALLREETSGNARTASAVGLGVCVGILPVWGYQMILGVLLAGRLGLNRALVLIASNISFFPPVILLASLFTGALVLPGASPDIPESLSDVDLECVLGFGAIYLVGAIVLAVSAGTIAFGLTLAGLVVFRRPGKGESA
jgi:uncharacterized protein (DUF2062 family)